MTFTGIELRYTVRSDAQEPEYSKIQLEQPVTATLGDFEVTVEPGPDGAYLTARTVWGNSVRAAEEDLTPRLEAWAAELYLKRGFALRFRYDGGNPLVDDAVNGVSEGVVTWTADAIIADHLETLPTPSPSFTFSESVELVMAMWREYREGRSRLATAGYWVYTVLKTEHHIGDEPQREKTGVDDEVLKTLSDLSSERSHPRHARKHLKDKPLMTEPEVAWLEAAIPAIALQLSGLTKGKPPSTRLRMTDLPPLS